MDFPKTLVSNRDLVLLNDVWDEMLRLSGTKLHFSMAYHPESDGQTEVRNRGLEQYLCAFTTDRPTKWANFFPWAELALNCFRHEGLGTSPFEALYGRHPPPVITAPPSASTPPDVASLIRKRGKTIVWLCGNLEFKVGGRVLLKLQQYRQYSVAKPLSSKLSWRFYGPFELLERIEQVAYRLKLPEGSRVHNVFHVCLLKPFVENTNWGNTELPVLFSQGKPVVRPVRVLDRRTVWQNGTVVGEMQLEWSDNSGESPTWEPTDMVIMHFPTLLEDKESSKGRVVTGHPSARLKETVQQQGEEIDVERTGRPNAGRVAEAQEDFATAV